jgi:hypothetical protein
MATGRVRGAPVVVRTEKTSLTGSEAHGGYQNRIVTFHGNDGGRDRD